MTKIRIGAAFLLISMSVVAWLTLRPNTVSTPIEQPRKGGVGGATWYRAHRDLWAAADFVALDDQIATERALRAIVARNQQRLSGVDPEAIVTCLSVYLTALRQPDVDSFLAVYSAKRALRPESELRDDANLQAWHRELFGELFESGSSRDFLAKILDKASEGVGKPTAIGELGLLEVARSRSTGRANLIGSDLYREVGPTFSMYRDPKINWDEWMGPFVQGFPSITESIPTFADVMFGATGPPRVCECYLVLKGAEQLPFVIGVILFEVPGGEWAILEVHNYRPYFVCWPT